MISLIKAYWLWPIDSIIYRRLKIIFHSIRFYSQAVPSNKYVNRCWSNRFIGHTYSIVSWDRRECALRFTTMTCLCHSVYYFLSFLMLSFFFFNHIALNTPCRDAKFTFYFLVKPSNYSNCLNCSFCALSGRLKKYIYLKLWCYCMKTNTMRKGSEMCEMRELHTEFQSKKCLKCGKM